MKKLKNRVVVFLLTFSIFQPIYAENFSVKLIKGNKEIETIDTIISKKNNNYAVAKDQVVWVTNKNENFIIAPIISTEEKKSGCYLQLLNSDYQLAAQYLIEKNEDVQSCDAVIAIFGCQLNPPLLNGIGVIVGMRLGANHYFAQSSFFDVTENNQLKENNSLSNKIGSVDSVGKAKKKLSCIK